MNFHLLKSVLSLKSKLLSYTFLNVPAVLFIILYKVILTFESADEILKCDQSIESY